MPEGYSYEFITEEDKKREVESAIRQVELDLYRTDQQLGVGELDEDEQEIFKERKRNLIAEARRLRGIINSNKQWQEMDPKEGEHERTERESRRS